MPNLDKDENEILESYEKGEWRSLKSKKKQLSKYQKYATETFLKNKRVNIRISKRVLEGIQKKAIREGIPYQTLMSSVLHKYISGSLVEK